MGSLAATAWVASRRIWRSCGVMRPIISVVFTYMVATDDVTIHAVCVALTAALLGFVLYLILTLDRPFVGSLAVSTDSYQQVVDDWLARPPLR